MALNLHFLRFFSAAAHTGRFSRAAYELNVSQPAIERCARLRATGGMSAARPGSTRRPANT
ncbi:LysR family transcriptional regulator [Methylobacterium sp. NEAU K]|uniref:LysR family transcriptional regulator n=1 Tax=Methylobacterium sp. NEAU K TaxID=3064946 RepID=UPI00351E4ACA